MRKSFLLFCVCVVFPVEVSVGSYYLGGSYGWSDLDSGVTAVTGTAQLDEEDSGFKVFAGLDLNKTFSVEAHYADLGEILLTGNTGDTYTVHDTLFTFTANGTEIKADGTSYGVSALVRLPIDGKIKPFAKLGFHYWDIDGSISAPVAGATVSEDGKDVLYGVGVEVEANDRLSARVEFERYEFGEGFNYLSFGLILRSN